MAKTDLTLDGLYKMVAYIYASLASNFPFDRGDANKALLLLCLQLADAMQDVKVEVADMLRSAAIRIGNSANDPGAPGHSFNEPELCPSSYKLEQLAA